MAVMVVITTLGRRGSLPWPMNCLVRQSVVVLLKGERDATVGFERDGCSTVKGVERCSEQTHARSAS
jgi:hypothetical protein